MTTAEHIQNAMMHAELAGQSFVAIKTDTNYVVFNIKDKTYEQHAHFSVDKLIAEGYWDSIFWYDPCRDTEQS